MENQGKAVNWLLSARVVRPAIGGLPHRREGQIAGDEIATAERLRDNNRRMGVEVTPRQTRMRMSGWKLTSLNVIPLRGAFHIRFFCRTVWAALAWKNHPDCFS